MKNFYKLKYELLNNFNHQRIYISTTGEKNYNLVINDTEIKIEKGIINILEKNNKIYSINLKDIVKIKFSHFKITIYLPNTQVEIET